MNDDHIKVSFTFSDGRRYTTEINSDIWLKKIGVSKFRGGNGDLYKVTLYPAEMIVPLTICREAIEDMLLMLPREQIIDILKSAEEQLR